MQLCKQSRHLPTLPDCQKNTEKTAQKRKQILMCLPRYSDKLHFFGEIKNKQNYYSPQKTSKTEGTLYYGCGLFWQRFIGFFFSNHRTSCHINNLLSGFGLFNVLAPTTEKAIRNFLIHVFPGKVQLLTTAHQMTMLTKRSTSFNVGLHGTQSQSREFGCIGDWFEHSCPSWSRALGGWVTTTAADPWDPGGKETF